MHIEMIHQCNYVVGVALNRDVAQSQDTAAEASQVWRDDSPPWWHLGELRKPLFRAQWKRVNEHHRLASAGFEVANRARGEFRDFDQHTIILSATLDLQGVLIDDRTMHRLIATIALSLIALTFAACTLKEETSMIPAPEDVAAPPANASKTASGLASRILRVGLSNVRPSPQSTVTVHYTGWTTDGKMFDSSLEGGQPISFRVTQVIPGWTEGLQLMVVGEKRRFWIPGNLAYDNSPNPDAPKGTLVFDVELLAVN
jgi:hypothetical protein